MIRTVLIFISVLHITSAQQIFQKQGINYNAKVTIHRGRDKVIGYPHAPQRPLQPWIQGDRITKQEIVQNLAKELLSQRKSSDQRRDEHWKSDDEKMEEYAFQRAKLARMQMESEEMEERRTAEAQQNLQPQPQPIPNRGPPPAVGYRRDPQQRRPLPRPSNSNNQAWTSEFMMRRRPNRRLRKDIP